MQGKNQFAISDCNIPSHLPVCPQLLSHSHFLLRMGPLSGNPFFFKQTCTWSYAQKHIQTHTHTRTHNSTGDQRWLVLTPTYQRQKYVCVWWCLAGWHLPSQAWNNESFPTVADNVSRKSRELGFNEIKTLCARFGYCSNSK